MACCYEIRESSSKKGRGLFATRPIKDGEEIFVEKPLVSMQFAWNESCKYKACHHCLKSLENAQEMCRRLSQRTDTILPRMDLCEVTPEKHLTCPTCDALFCSKECFEEAVSIYHRILCTGGDPSHPIARLIDTWKQMHYPPETFNIMLIVRLFATIKQAPSEQERAALLKRLNTFCHAVKNEEDNITHKLLGQNFQDLIEICRGMLTEVVYEESLKECFTADGFRSLLALIGTNGQGIGTSSFSVWANNCDKIDDKRERRELSKLIDKLYEDINNVSAPFLDCEGSGLYTLQSSCNHSCDPNAQVTFPFNSHVLSLKALRDIEKGEEICISYLSECDQGRSRHSRQQILRENYLFSCNCSLCQDQIDQPDLTSEEEEEEDGDDGDCSMEED